MNKKMSYTLLLCLLGWLCCLPALALQTKSIKDNGMAWATIATQGVTRIAVTNDRITNVRGPSGRYNIQNDNNQGAVFIQLAEDTQASFTIFIATENNHNYVLRLAPKQQVADTILLKPKDVINKAAEHWEKTTPYLEATTQLIHDMANHSSPEDYAVNSVSGAPQHYLGSIATFTLITVYTGAHLEGRIFCLQNRTNQTIRLTESEFYQPGDRAIALSHLIIPPRGRAWVYKVMSHG